MKNLILILLSVPLLFTACKKEGCQDVNALNFDPEAQKDGNCKYTKIIFYAPSNLIGGVGIKVTKIEVFKGSIDLGYLIGTIDNIPDQSPAPEGCIPPANAIEYNFESKAEDALFRTRYYFENGVDDAGHSFEISTGPTTECIVQKLTI